MGKLNEKDLFAAMQADCVGKPDARIEERLLYTMMLKSSREPARQNSMSGFAGWLFSLQGMGIKTAVFSCLLVVSLMNNHLYQGKGISGQNDSVFVEKIMVADSTRILQEFNTNKNDTLF